MIRNTLQDIKIDERNRKSADRMRLKRAEDKMQLHEYIPVLEDRHIECDSCVFSWRAINEIDDGSYIICSKGIDVPDRTDGFCACFQKKDGRL